MMLSHILFVTKRDICSFQLYSLTADKTYEKIEDYSGMENSGFVEPDWAKLEAEKNPKEEVEEKGEHTHGPKKERTVLVLNRDVQDPIIRASLVSTFINVSNVIEYLKTSRLIDPNYNFVKSVYLEDLEFPWSLVVTTKQIEIENGFEYQKFLEDILSWFEVDDSAKMVLKEGKFSEK